MVLSTFLSIFNSRNVRYGEALERDQSIVRMQVCFGKRGSLLLMGLSHLPIDDPCRSRGLPSSYCREFIDTFNAPLGTPHTRRIEAALCLGDIASQARTRTIAYTMPAVLGVTITRGFCSKDQKDDSNRSFIKDPTVPERLVAERAEMDRYGRRSIS